MGKKKIEKMFLGVQDKINTVKYLYDRKICYTNFKEAAFEINKLMREYMETINYLYLFDMISKENFNYAHSLVEKFDNCLF